MNSDIVEAESVHWLFGRLAPDSSLIINAFFDPTINNIVGAGAGMMVVVGGIAVVAVLTYFRWWKPLWTDWLCSIDHKRIGIMYIVLSLVMLARGVAEGVVMRTQQAYALDGGGFLEDSHYGELFSTHGTIMIFFVAMPFISGVINYVLPLQLGSRDVAFPLMNQLSLSMTFAGAALIMISLVVGEFSTGGWAAYPPYTGKEFSPGVGPDYWIWCVAIAGIGSTMSGINFAVTIFKERAPGMGLFHMPIFCWTVLCTSIIMIFALPPLTVATALLALDRYLDFHFFTNDLGGNMMNYVNLFWLFGHPEVYLLILPAYGIFSEISATYSGKRIYGYNSLVYATMVIAVLSFTVWLHHFFTMGQSANVNVVFGVASMAIAIPTGVKIYDWLATMYGGRIRLSVPMIYLIGFFYLFTIGGLTGVMLANPTISYQVHNTLFLVAHFHNVIIPGVLFGLLAGYHHWFPKVFGFRLHEGLGRVTALLWIFGFSFAFFPLYALGLLGMPRRSVSYTNPDFEPYTLVAMFGSLLVLSALVCLIAQLAVSILRRQELAAPGGDPWNAGSLEWSVSAPAPEYNFAVLPKVEGRDAFWVAKINGTAYRHPESYEDIEMPTNTRIGAVYGITFTALGFALVWHMWWLAILALVISFIEFMIRIFDMDTTETIPAERVREEYEAWLNQVEHLPAATRADEATPRNRGVATMELEGVTL